MVKILVTDAETNEIYMDETVDVVLGCAVLNKNKLKIETANFVIGQSSVDDILIVLDDFCRDFKKDVVKKQIVNLLKQ